MPEGPACQRRYLPTVQAAGAQEEARWHAARGCRRTRTRAPPDDAPRQVCTCCGVGCAHVGCEESTTGQEYCEDFVESGCDWFCCQARQPWGVAQVVLPAPPVLDAPFKACPAGQPSRRPCLRPRAAHALNPNGARASTPPAHALLRPAPHHPVGVRGAAPRAGAKGRPAAARQGRLTVHPRDRAPVRRHGQGSVPAHAPRPRVGACRRCRQCSTACAERTCLAQEGHGASVACVPGLEPVHGAPCACARRPPSFRRVPFHHRPRAAAHAQRLW